MATEITHVIDPDMGSGYDYASLNAWEAAQQRNLVSADEIAIATCRSTSSSADTTNLNISGWTTDITRYIKIWTDPAESYRHNGTYQVTKYRLEISNDDAIKFVEQYIRVFGLQIQVSKSDTGTSRGITWGSISSGSEYHIAENIIKQGSSSNGNVEGIQVGDGQIEVKIWNNIIYDFIQGTGYGIYLDNTEKAYVFNNTIINCDIGIQLDNVGTEAIIKNNALNDNTTNISGTFSTESEHNVVDVVSDGAFGVTWSTGITDGTTTNKLIDSGATFQTDGVQINSIIKNTTDTIYTYVTAVDSEIQLSLNDDIFVSGEGYDIYKNIFGDIVFEDAGSDDFHLNSTDTIAKDKGADLSSDTDLSFSDDIDGDTRSVPWDIGADEFVSIGAAIAKIAGILKASIATFASISAASIAKVAGIDY